jgi:hypothetical protein
VSRGNLFEQLSPTLQVTVDEQIAQIDTLSNIINSAEREMLRLRKAYENAIEARDATGVTLIDRNDEISILYEKSNVLVRPMTR